MKLPLKNIKIIILSYLMVTASPVAHAGEDSDILEGMAKTFTKGFVENEAKKMADKVIYKMLVESGSTAAANEAGKQLAQEGAKGAGKAHGSHTVVSDAFAVYDFVDGLYDLSKSNTDTQRFLNASRSAGAVVTYMFPPAGVIVMVALVGVQLNVAIISAKYAKDIARISAEVSEVAARSSEIAKEIFINELNYVTFSLAELKAVSMTVERVAQHQAEKCTVVAMDTLRKVAYCLSLTRVKRDLAEIRADLLDNVIQFPGKFVNTNTYAEFLKLDPTKLTTDRAAAEKSLERLNQDVESSDKELQNFSIELLDEQRKNSPEFVEGQLKIACSRQQRENVKDLLLVEKELIKTTGELKRMQIKARLTRRIADQKNRIDFKCANLNSDNTQAIEIYDRIVKRLGGLK